MATTVTFNPLTGNFDAVLLATANVQAWMATPSSANLLAALSDKTGTGLNVFATAPSLAGPVTLTEAVGSSGLTITGATQTASFPALSITQTWNNAGVTFNGVLLNFTSTASAGASKALDIQLASASVFSVRKDGFAAASVGFGSQSWYNASGGLLAGANTVATVANTWNVAAGLGINSNAVLLAPAVATVQCGADINGAAVSQQLQAANGITGTDRTGGNFTVASGKGTGAGAVSSLIFQTPTVLASGTTAQSLATRLTLSSAGAVFAGSITTLGGATLHTTSSALTDGAGVSAGTITNAPSVGNPTKWIGISDNGVTRYIPAW